MQLGTKVNPEGVQEILVQIFETQAVEVFTSYSEFDESTRKFLSPKECADYLSTRAANNLNSTGFAIHYLDTEGFVRDTRINLKPEKCAGHSFRFMIEGWGLIRVDFSLDEEHQIYCDIGANSEKRANTWYVNYPQFKDPSLWNWRLVEKHLRSLKRILKSLEVA
jgi:hypothetical protein